MLKKKKVLGTLACALAVASLGLTSVSAAEFGTAVNIEAKTTTVNVTIPSKYAMVFNEDGTDTLPTNLTITNNSKIAGVHLSSIELDAGTSGWQLLSESSDLKTQAVDTKAVKLKIGETGKEVLAVPTNGTKDSTGTVTLGQDKFAIPAEGTNTLNFIVERGAFSQASADAKAFSMVMNFEYNS